MIRYSARILILTILMLGPGILSAEHYPWQFSFQTGQTAPTENFSKLADNDKDLGLSIQYMSYPYLGGRIAYDSQIFDLGWTRTNIKASTLSIDGVLLYSLPKYVQIFALAGPTYFSFQNQGLINYDSDGKDIGWNAGAGFDIYPIERWGIRFQSVYYSALLKKEEPRLSWVTSTLGLIFRF
jgi:hypothetical protein